MKRGEVYWADLAPRSGSEQQGRRPVVIVSDDGFNNAPTWGSIIVVPLSTSTNQRERGPSAILLPQKTAGLRQESVALCHQVTTLDKSKFARRIGRLTGGELSQVEAGLKAALDLS